MKDQIQNAMRKIPSMDKLLSQPWVAGFEAELGRETAKSIIADVLARQRARIVKDPDTAFDADSIARAAKKELTAKARRSLRHVVNATGVVIHTNLGRSLLADEAIAAVADVAGHYNTLEYDPQEGCRGQRNDHVEWLLCRLTGAEAAIVVNNNAGAVVLALGALAKDREAVVSRGELVEIGGSFRIPEIMALSGTRMVDVGTTNRTHLRDYESAITEETAMLLKVHPSNYRVCGFTEAVPREELAALAHGRGLVFMEDLGSGMLVDTSSVGLTSDPTVSACLKAGVDVVTFSGDKLLGGPQIGVIAGKSAIIDKLRKYPLLRALRVDKMTLSALEATLRLYLKGSYGSIPSLRMVFVSPEALRRQAQLFARRLKTFFAGTSLRSVQTEIIETKDAVGGGTFPQSELKGYGVAVKIPELGTTGRLAEKLRLASVPVVSGAADDRLVFHARTMSREDEKLVMDAFAEILSIADRG